MLFLINELSYIEQAKDVYSADELMREFWKIIQEIQPIQKDHSLLKHSSLSDRKLCPNVSLREWLHRKLKSSNSKDKIIADFLIRIITKNPYIEEYLKNHVCYLNKVDIAYSALAGAAFLNGILISLKDSSEFSNESITVEFGTDAKNLQTKKIDNLITVQQARKLCPRYNPNPKHDLLGGWRGATPMDLNDKEAQEALYKSVNNGTRRYSYYKGKYYEFKSDNAFNELGYPTYHGYPIDEQNVPNSVRRELE